MGLWSHAFSKRFFLTTRKHAVLNAIAIPTFEGSCRRFRRWRTVQTRFESLAAIRCTAYVFVCVVTSAPKLRKEKKRVAKMEVVTNSIEVAEDAGLRYVSDDQPGYTRKPKGDDFEYFDTEGKPIRDEQRLLRIKRLTIPPAYTDVWICPSANGHIQAMGRDARRRKQYRYHERWRAARDEDKYDRMVLFGEALPKIRKRVEADLALPGLRQNKVLAAVVQLLQRTFIRVGNEEYARDNKSFGLTTMKGWHVDVNGSKLRFRFRGKSGIKHDVDIQDR